MKKLFLMIAVIATLSVVSCNNNNTHNDNKEGIDSMHHHDNQFDEENDSIGNQRRGYSDQTQDSAVTPTAPSLTE